MFTNKLHNIVWNTVKANYAIGTESHVFRHNFTTVLRNILKFLLSAHLSSCTYIADAKAQIPHHCSPLLGPGQDHHHDKEGINEWC